MFCRIWYSAEFHVGRGCMGSDFAPWIWGITSMKNLSILSCQEKEASLSNDGGAILFFAPCDKGLFWRL